MASAMMNESVTGFERHIVSQRLNVSETANEIPVTVISDFLD